jgi:hypothetical protein
MPTQKQLLRFAITCFALSSIVFLLIFMHGCAAMKSPTAATVNQSITIAIADAGAAAIQAEAEYNAGTIPQTATSRKIINTLGNDYNDAKAAWIVYLQAVATVQAAQSQQITACAPPPAGTTPPASNGCAAATTAASAAQANVTAAQVALDNKVSALTVDTNAVKAISK